jgi:hypothetical protein
MGAEGDGEVSAKCNTRSTKGEKYHGTMRDMIAASEWHHTCFLQSPAGGTQWVYSGRLIVVSVRTNKRHHQSVCFITAGPITKLFAWGEEESGGHVL